MPAYPVNPGDILAGKYRVERVLGQGGMGVVVAATHIELQQLVAMKFLVPGGDARPESRARLLQEARAAVRLRSQHVARVFDVGTLENGAPYIVMDHLHGCDLSSLLERRGPLPFEEAVEYVLQACEAIGEAHQAGILHRDLKPANLFLTTNVDNSPCVKVLDFGISKLMGSSVALTEPDHAIGSLLYMSPEQIATPKDVDPRCDIWALGVVLYQLVSGQTPFDSGSPHEVTAWVMWAEPKSLDLLRSDVPAGLSAVILQCLQKDRERRWPSVAALAAALVPYAPTRATAYAERVARVLGVQAPAAHTTAPLPAKDRPMVRGAIGSAPGLVVSAQEASTHAPTISPWGMDHELQSRDPGGGPAPASTTRAAERRRKIGRALVAGGGVILLAAAGVASARLRGEPTTSREAPRGTEAAAQVQSLEPLAGRGDVLVTAPAEPPAAPTVSATGTSVTAPTGALTATSSPPPGKLPDASPGRARSAPKPAGEDPYGGRR